MPFFELFRLDEHKKKMEQELRHEIKNEAQGLLLNHERLKRDLKEKGIDVDAEHERMDSSDSIMDSTFDSSGPNVYSHDQNASSDASSPESEQKREIRNRDQKNS